MWTLPAYFRALWLLCALLAPGPATASRDIDKLLATPEHQIDVGLAALTFAREIYPEIDVQAYSRRIDALALDASRTVMRARARNPEDIVRALNTWYYREYGVRYDTSPDARRKQGNYFINGLLDTRAGTCVTLPMLYMAIAQRLGYPVYPVTAPEHMFVRFLDPGLAHQNLELSAGAGYSPDEEYAWRLNISARGIRSGAYLRTLSYREFLGILLQQNAIVFSKRGEEARSIDYFEKAQRLDPKNVYFPRNLGRAWSDKARRTKDPTLAARYRAKSQAYFAQAHEMGWTYDPDANTRSK